MSSKSCKWCGNKISDFDDECFDCCVFRKEVERSPVIALKILKELYFKKQEQGQTEKKCVGNFY